MRKRNLIIISSILIVVAYIIVINNKVTISTADKDKCLNIDLTMFKNGNEIFISPAELHKQLEQKNMSSLVVLDASHPKVYAKGHIPGALSIGFKGLSDTTGKPGDKKWGTILSKEKLIKKLKSLGVANDKLVVVYFDIDKGPGAGGRAVWQLKMAGFENVRLMYGGLEVWKRLGYELSKTTSKPIPAKNLILKDYNESFRAKQKYIFENLSNLKIVDVRSFKEYTGKDTSRGEARAGHIKGAKWLSWKSVLNEDTTVKPPEEITNLMAGIGIKPGDDFVLY